MPVKGTRRYQRLFKNVTNWQEYIFRKGDRKKRSLLFVTRPYPVSFHVPESLYQVFKEIFMEDFYEIEDLVKKLPAKPVIIDVGANAGFFDILIFSKIKHPEIYAYEPMPSNITLFQQTIDANPNMETVRLHQKAVTGKPIDHIELFTADTEDNTVVSSIFSDFHGLNNKKISVTAQSLTSIMEENNLTSVDLLKLDCEGSEYDIIYNTDRAIFTRIKMLVIEVHNMETDRYNLTSLNEYLQSLGYNTRYQPVQEGCFFLEAIKK